MPWSFLEVASSQPLDSRRDPRLRFFCLLPDAKRLSVFAKYHGRPEEMRARVVVFECFFRSFSTIRQKAGWWQS